MALHFITPIITTVQTRSWIWRMISRYASCYRYLPTHSIAWSNVKVIWRSSSASSTNESNATIGFLPTIILNSGNFAFTIICYNMRLNYQAHTTIRLRRIGHFVKNDEMLPNWLFRNSDFIWNIFVFHNTIIGIVAIHAWIIMAAGGSDIHIVLHKTLSQVHWWLIWNHHHMVSNYTFLLGPERFHNLHESMPCSSANFSRTCSLGSNVGQHDTKSHK